MKTAALARWLIVIDNSIGLGSLTFMSTKPQPRYLNFALLVSASIILPFAFLSLSAPFAQVMPMNDVLLYGWWLQLMQQGQPVFGIAQPFVYPYPSLAPMWLALLLGGSSGILVGWCSLIALLNVLAIGFLTSWGRGGKRSFYAAWVWVCYLLLLGPAGIARIDAVAAALAVIGIVLFARGKTFGAMVLFTAGAWVKIWPFALALAAFISSKSKKILAYGATLVVSLVLLFAFFTGGNSNVFSFIFTQSGRGIQVESTIATFWLWAAKLGLGNSGIYYDKEIITNQVYGDFVELVSVLMTPIMFGALAITIWLGFKALKANANQHQLFTAVAMTGVLDLIVFNKVGSPQFMCWIVVPLIAWVYFGLSTPKWLLAAFGAVALFTNLVYPVFYIDLMALGYLSVSLLTIRNLALIALLIWANRQLIALGNGRSLEAEPKSSVTL